MLASASDRSLSHRKMRLATGGLFLTSVFSSAVTNAARSLCIWATWRESEREARARSLASFVVSVPYRSPLSHDLDAPSIRRAIRYANCAWQRRIALVAREHQLESSLSEAR